MVITARTPNGGAQTSALVSPIDASSLDDGKWWQELSPSLPDIPTTDFPGHDDLAIGSQSGNVGGIGRALPNGEAVNIAPAQHPNHDEQRPSQPTIDFQAGRWAPGGDRVCEETLLLRSQSSTR